MFCVLEEPSLRYRMGELVRPAEAPPPLRDYIRRTATTVVNTPGGTPGR
jgi:hypothetical protein